MQLYENDPFKLVDGTGRLWDFKVRASKIVRQFWVRETIQLFIETRSYFLRKHFSNFHWIVLFQGRRSDLVFGTAFSWDNSVSCFFKQYMIYFLAFCYREGAGGASPQNDFCPSPLIFSSRKPVIWIEMGNFGQAMAVPTERKVWVHSHSYWKVFACSFEQHSWIKSNIWNLVLVAIQFWIPISKSSTLQTRLCKPRKPKHSLSTLLAVPILTALCSMTFKGRQLLHLPDI